MRRLVWILLILLASVWIGLKLSEDPGYALFGYKALSVEMPLWAAFAGFMVLILILYFLVRFFDGIGMMGVRLKNWLRMHRKHQAHSKTNQGLVELLEGDWPSAEVYLSDGAYQSETPFVNYLAAAKAAHEQGASDRVYDYLQKAQAIIPSAEIAIGLLQAEFQTEKGQLDQSVLTLKKCHERAPKNKLVLQKLQKLYIRLADWDNLLTLLPVLRKEKLIARSQLDNFEAHIYQQCLNQAGSKKDNLIEIHGIWEQVPRKLHAHAELVSVYVNKLMPYPAAVKEIEILIASILKKNWQEDLVHTYGLLVTDNPKRQLALAEEWLKQYGYHAILFLTLGRLCMRCQLWGKAKTYYEQALKADGNPESYVEYGKLLEQLGDQKAAYEHYRLAIGKCRVGKS